MFLHTYIKFMHKLPHQFPIDLRLSDKFPSWRGHLFNICITTTTKSMCWQLSRWRCLNVALWRCIQSWTLARMWEGGLRRELYKTPVDYWRCEVPETISTMFGDLDWKIHATRSLLSSSRSNYVAFWTDTLRSRCATRWPTTGKWLMYGKVGGSERSESLGSFWGVLSMNVTKYKW